MPNSNQFCTKAKCENIDNSQFYNDYWSFSVDELLLLIENTKIDKVMIHGCCKEGASLSWLYCVWESLSSTSISTFKEK